jgi:hypothetical protein
MKTILPLLVASIVAGSCLAGAASRLPALKAQRWVNSAPLTPEGLRGKVVLVDVWEYTCINWIRTLPYVRAWNRDYASLGLLVVGVHSPEFEFGKRAENVDRGIRDHGLTYPIAIDNEFAIWRTLDNDAWPAKYLFDGQGQLVKRWVGEGSYDEIESEIRRLLAAADPGVRLPARQPDPGKRGTPRSEDATGDPSSPLYDLPLAVERVRARASAIDQSRADILLSQGRVLPRRPSRPRFASRSDGCRRAPRWTRTCSSRLAPTTQRRLKRSSRRFDQSRLTSWWSGTVA